MAYLHHDVRRRDWIARREAAASAGIRREAKLGKVCPNCGTSEKTCASYLAARGFGCCQSCEHPDVAKEAK